MKRFRDGFAHHRSKLWLLAAVVIGLLILNVAAVRDTAPVRYEYKTVWFRMNAVNDPSHLQDTFSTALNKEAAVGWEFVGRCAHCSTPETWVDYVVFRRPRR